MLFMHGQLFCVPQGDGRLRDRGFALPDAVPGARCRYSAICRVRPARHKKIKSKQYFAGKQLIFM